MMLPKLFLIACLCLTAYASHGQGIDETDVDNPWGRQLFWSKLYHAFIDERNLENPDGKYDVSEEDAGQGIDEENIDNLWLKLEAREDSEEEENVEEENHKSYIVNVIIPRRCLFEEDAGQGIDEENIDKPWANSESTEEDSGQGIDEENVNNPWANSDSTEEDSGQGIDEENVNNPWASSEEESEELVLTSSISDMIPDAVIKLNKAIDYLLDFVRTAFTEDGQITIPLPPFNKKFGSGLFKGNFSANGGYFKNPASLERTGDVAIGKQGDKIILEVALGLKTLEAGYDSYSLDIMSIHQKGHLKFGVGHDSLKLKAALTYAPKCHFEVNEIAVDKLDGIKVDIDGLGVFQSMFDVLKKWLLDNFEGQFKTILNKTLHDKVMAALQKHDICDKIPKL